MHSLRVPCEGWMEPARCRPARVGAKWLARRSFQHEQMTARALMKANREELVRDSSGQPGPVRSFAIYCHSRLLIQASTSALALQPSQALTTQPPSKR